MTRLVLMLMVLAAGSLLANATLNIHLHAADIASLFLGAALIVAGVCAAIFMGVRTR